MPIRNYFQSISLLCFKVLFVLTAIFPTENTYGQPSIPEDRMYLKISPDFAKLEQNIYLPNFPGHEPTHFIQWIYVYKHGLLISEKAFLAYDLTRLDTERIFKYNSQGKIVKDSSYYPSLPELNTYTTYAYNAKGMLIQATKRKTSNEEVQRIDNYQKYKDEGTYEMTCQFFGDDNKKTVKYSSIYKNGLKQTIIFSNGFAPTHYEYDLAGKLIVRNSRKYFYKLDERGNAIATVEIERGMRIYNFMRITYADGTVTGNLEPDKDFIQEWDNRK